MLPRRAVGVVPARATLAAPTPGGTVAVEAALTGGLVAAGVPASAALPAVLIYRAATRRLRVPPGWVAMTVLRRRGVV